MNKLFSLNFLVAFLVYFCLAVPHVAFSSGNTPNYQSKLCKVHDLIKKIDLFYEDYYLVNEKKYEELYTTYFKEVYSAIQRNEKNECADIPLMVKANTLIGGRCIDKNKGCRIYFGYIINKAIKKFYSRAMVSDYMKFLIDNLGSADESKSFFSEQIFRINPNVYFEELGKLQKQDQDLIIEELTWGIINNYGYPHFRKCSTDDENLKDIKSIYRKRIDYKKYKKWLAEIAVLLKDWECDTFLSENVKVRDENKDEYLNGNYGSVSQYYGYIGIFPKDIIFAEKNDYLTDELPATEEDKTIMSSIYDQLSDYCRSKNTGSCHALSYDYRDDSFSSFDIKRIDNMFISNQPIYRVSDTRKYPIYDIVFAYGGKDEPYKPLFFWFDGSYASLENEITPEVLNENYNKTVRNEPLLRIGPPNLMYYVSFYLYLTSKPPGDYIIDLPDDYKRYCAITERCKGLPETIEKVKQQNGGLTPTKIEQIKLNDHPAWRVTVNTISSCGHFNTRTLTVTEIGEVYLNSISETYPLPFTDHCYTFHSKKQTEIKSENK